MPCDGSRGLTPACEPQHAVSNPHVVLLSRGAVVAAAARGGDLPTSAVRPPWPSVGGPPRGRRCLRQRSHRSAPAADSAAPSGRAVPSPRLQGCDRSPPIGGAPPPCLSPCQLPRRSRAPSRHDPPQPSLP